MSVIDLLKLVHTYRCTYVYVGVCAYADMSVYAYIENYDSVGCG